MATPDGQERFAMVKKRHYHTFHEAVENKKADPKIIPLCTFLNDQNEFFSASSCSGRIVILNLDKDENKQESAFYYKKHGTVRASELWKKIKAKTTHTLWFKQEPFILHLGTNTLENANRILEWAGKAGIKRCGIIVAKPGKFIIEMIGTQGLAIPVKNENQVFITETFFSTAVKIANQKLQRNFKRLQKLETIIRTDLKEKK